MLKGSPDHRERLGIPLAPASPSLCLQFPGSSLPCSLWVRGQVCPYTPSKLILYREEEKGRSSPSRCIRSPCNMWGSREKTKTNLNTVQRSLCAGVSSHHIWRVKSVLSMFLALASESVLACSLGGPSHLLICLALLMFLLLLSSFKKQPFPWS